MSGFIDKLHLQFFILKQKMHDKLYKNLTVIQQFRESGNVLNSEILDFRIFCILEIMNQ